MHPLERRIFPQSIYFFLASDLHITIISIIRSSAIDAIDKHGNAIKLAIVNTILKTQIADCHVNNYPCVLALMSENISYPIQAKLIGLHNADAQVITKENKLITTS